MRATFSGWKTALWDAGERTGSRRTEGKGKGCDVRRQGFEHLRRMDWLHRQGCLCPGGLRLRRWSWVHRQGMLCLDPRQSPGLLTGLPARDSRPVFPFMSEIPKTYEPQAIEEKWYAFWLESGCFTADPAVRRSRAYSIVIPPPNVTGVLTLGHVLNNTIQDILARRARMLGQEVLWLPGTDHAGIATQNVVEKTLRKEGAMKHRDDLGREALVEKIWEWKEKYGGIIIQQLKKLGASCDWSRERFTMDPRVLALRAAGVRGPLQKGADLSRQADGELVPRLAHRAQRRGGGDEGAERRRCITSKWRWRRSRAPRSRSRPRGRRRSPAIPRWR